MSKTYKDHPVVRREQARLDHLKYRRQAQESRRLVAQWYTQEDDEEDDN